MAVPLELVQAARSGGVTEMDRLVEAVWPEAYRLAFGILGERPSAQDAAQDVCITVYRTLGSLRVTDAFHTWLYRIIIRAASAQRRRRSQNAPAVASQANATDSDAAIDVWRALATLPPKLRILVVLRYYEDFTSKEIATILHVPSGTVRFQLLVARRLLRPYLDTGREPMCAVKREVSGNAN
jgi:RNA polymerase sigma-70 factor (ECF subfamily)